jgi:hypothetical protein
MPAQTVIKLRRDTAANWTTVDPVLAAGEAGFESDSNKLKIGDGISLWSELSYASGGGGVAIDDTAPTDTEATPLWWDTATGTLYIYYDNFWVEAVVGQVGPQGPSGVATAVAPITYDAGTQSIGIDQSGISITKSQITDFAHTHEISDVTGLGGALDAKQDVASAVSTKTGAYTLAASDTNDLVQANGTFTITVPASTFATGTRVDVANIGTGVITFAGSGLTLQSKESKVTIDKQYSAATLFFTSATTALLVGDLA